MLTVDQLTKSYDGGFTLGPVSLDFPAGEVAIVLGKNGAGKSTLFQLLTGNLDATDGAVRLGGERVTPDQPQVKRRIGYLPQNPVLPRWVTGHEILTYAARLYELKDPDVQVARAERGWDCDGFKNKPLATLSYGMQKRVGLALATLADPDLLILDEPHSGLDLFHVKALDDEILRRRAAGKTTVLSTHVAAFAAGVGDRVLKVEAGQAREVAGFREEGFLERIRLIEATFFGVSG